jgi:hypothetical protein
MTCVEHHNYLLLVYHTFTVYQGKNMIKTCSMVMLLTIATVVTPMQKTTTTHTQKAKNHISEVLTYSKHALKQMGERKISAAEVEYVLKTGYRSWEDEERGTRKFTERTKKGKQLVVILARNNDPNMVATAYRINSAN